MKSFGTACCLLLLATASFCNGFSMDDLALYDLVEEVNANFYEFFGVQQTASLSEIKKAYRRLSLEWHPDRNEAPDATEQFRKVAGIYDILKNKESRAKYDDVLEFGLPDWRQPIYYFRRVRKLNWSETVLVLVFVFSIGHYLMMWGSYFEKTLVVKSNKKKRKDRKKGQASEIEEDDGLEEFKPKFFDLLPFVIGRGCVILAKELKYLAQEALTKTKEVDELEEESEEFVRPKRATAEPVIYKMASDVKAVNNNDAKAEERYLIEKIQNSVEKETSTKGQKWSKEEISKLVKLTTKYPVGSSNRWQNLARDMNRSVDDITSTIEKLRKKEDTYSLESLQNQTKKADLSKSSPAAATEAKKPELEWTQNEQKLLEAALQHFPKGTPERWEKVASCIPNKTPAQCMERFKHLAEMDVAVDVHGTFEKLDTSARRCEKSRGLIQMYFGAFQPTSSQPVFNCGLQVQQAMSQQYQQQNQQQFAQQETRNCFAATPASPSRKRRADDAMRIDDCSNKKLKFSPKRIQRQLSNFHIDARPRHDPNPDPLSASSSSDEEMMDDDNRNSNQPGVVVEEPEEDQETPSISLSTEAREYLQRCNEAHPLPFPFLKQPSNYGAVIPYNRAAAFPRTDDPSMYGRIEEVDDESSCDGNVSSPPRIEFPDDEVSARSESSSPSMSQQDSPSCYIEEVVQQDDDMEEMDMD